MSDKQISVVLEAVQSGAATSTEVSSLTGLSVPAASSYLSQLYELGMITRERGMVRFAVRGHSSYRYSPAVSQNRDTARMA